MDTGTITQLVGSLGFPVFACCAMGWYIFQSDKRHAETIEALTECMEAVKESVNELTLGIKDLTREVDETQRAVERR